MIDSGNKLLENRIHLFDPVGLINDGYSGYRASNYTSFTDTNSGGLRSYNHSIRDSNNGQVIRSYYDHRIEDSKFSNGGGSRFELETTIEDHESDLSTPSLWSSSPTSPKAMAMGSPIHAMSPNSKTRAIAKGRRELMDMVRDLPESFYELSLKDIVDQKATMDNINLQEEKKPIKETIKPKERNKQKKSNKKKKNVRSESFDNGKFLLKTSVFPFLLGSKKSKKKSLVSNGSFKIAPIPNPQSTTSSGSMKCVEKEWWRRRSSESDRNSRSTGSSSSRSSSSNQRHRIRFLPSCCFFNGRRIKGKK